MLLGDKPEEGNMCDLWEYQTREMLVRVWVIKELFFSGLPNGPDQLGDEVKLKQNKQPGLPFLLTVNTL